MYNYNQFSRSSGNFFSRLYKSAAEEIPAHLLPEYAKQSLVLNQQTRLPLGGRRELTPEEKLDIERHRARVLPHLFPSWGDKPEVEMYSPITSGVLGAGTGALVSAIPTALTSGIAAAFNASNSNRSGFEKGLVNLLGLSPLILGTGLGGLLGYKGRESANDTIEDIKRRFPEGATRRDVMSDPLYEKIRGEAMGTVIARALLEDKRDGGYESRRSRGMYY